MPNIGLDKFKDVLAKQPLNQVVQEYLFSGTPFVFREQPEQFEKLKRHLSDALDVKMENVIVVGSAMVGFSLNPDNFPRRFSDESDIDVVIIDEKLFDKIWMTILEWHYPRKINLPGRVDKEWASVRRKDIYWGWIVPDQIRYEGLTLPEALKPLRDISTTWFEAFKTLSLYPEFVTREVSGRLYRSWNHALIYHLDGLRQLQNILRK